MVTAFVYFDTTDPDGFVEALGTTGGLFEDVAGFHGFKLKRGIEDPRRFVLTAEWDSVDDHVSWQESNVSEFLGVLDPHLAGRPEITHFA